MTPAQVGAAPGLPAGWRGGCRSPRRGPGDNTSIFIHDNSSYYKEGSLASFQSSNRPPQLPPWAPALLGLLTGLLTVASGLWLEPGLQVSCWSWCPFSYQSTLQAWLSLPPSYSSLSTHGVPALLGSLTGVLTAALAEEKADSGNPEYYGVLLYCLYPSRVPPVDWTCLTNKTGEAVLRCPSSGEEVRAAVPRCLDLQLPGDHRTAGDQAAWQVPWFNTYHMILLH